MEGRHSSANKERTRTSIFLKSVHALLANAITKRILRSAKNTPIKTMTIEVIVQKAGAKARMLGERNNKGTRCDGLKLRLATASLSMCNDIFANPYFL